MKLVGAAAGAFAALALAGCGGSSGTGGTASPTVDKAALMKELGYDDPPPTAVDKYVATIRKHECRSDQKVSELEIAQMYDNDDADAVDDTRIAMTYICPDKVKVWDKARAEVDAL